MVAVLYEHHLIALVNAKFCKKVGLPKDAVLGHHVHYFIPMENSDIPHQVLKVGGIPCVISTLTMNHRDGTGGFVVKVYQDLYQLHDVMQPLSRLNMQLDYYKNELYKSNGTSYTF